MAEPDDSPELEAQIQAATDARDDVLAAELYRKQQGTTDAFEPEPAPVPAVVDTEGDAEVDAQPADDAAAELSGVEGMPTTAMDDYKPLDALTEAERDDEFESVMARSDPEMSSRELRVTWPGGDYDRNAEIIVATLKAIPGSAAAMRVLEVAGGVANHPEVMKWVAQVGRLLAVAGDPTTIKNLTSGVKTMANIATADIQAKIETLDDAIDKATALNDTDKANTLFQQQQALYRLLPGGADPAIGEGGRAL